MGAGFSPRSVFRSLSSGIQYRWCCDFRFDFVLWGRRTDIFIIFFFGTIRPPENGLPPPPVLLRATRAGGRSSSHQEYRALSCGEGGGALYCGQTENQPHAWQSAAKRQGCLYGASRVQATADSCFWAGHGGKILDRRQRSPLLRVLCFLSLDPFLFCSPCHAQLEPL